jgi:AraC-like DNA-binding protein
MVIHHSGVQEIKEHAHPAWNLVIPWAGHILLEAGKGPTRHAAGAILPPQVRHPASTVDHISVFIDPWFLGLGPGPGRAIPLDRHTVEHIRASWYPADGSDPDERATKTVALLRRRRQLPRAVSIDPRVAAAVTELAAAKCIDDVAASVRLSPSRLRALINDQIGTTPVQLRMWLRLRAAIVSLRATPIAVAACEAGFADQAHLTRIAVRLVGQTPGDLARVLRSRDQRLDSRTPTLATAA